MPELSPLSLSLIACADDPAALDALARTVEAYPCRVAPDELWLLTGPASRRAILDRARNAVAATGGIAEDQGDAWSALALDWPGAAEVFARLSAVPLGRERPAFLQCELAHVAGKALVLESYLGLLVPSPVGHHLEERILHGCRDLEVENGPLVEFDPSVGAPR